MTTEILKIIIGLCSVVGGDTNSFSSTIGQVQYSQTRCHEFYATCTLLHPIELCMRIRTKWEGNKNEHEQANLQARLDSKPEVFGPFK